MNPLASSPVAAVGSRGARARRVAKLLLGAAGLVPVARLCAAGARGGLGANPIETITHATGDWALRLLLLTLAVTPLRRLTGWHGAVAYRRLLGLLAFFYACLHLLTYVGLDLFFDWGAIVDDVRKRRFVIAGATAFLCLLPLALTSTRGWMRRLGRRWSQLHRLAYVAAVAAIVHYSWLVKADLRPPVAYAAVLSVLFALRLWHRGAAGGPPARGRGSGGTSAL